MGGGANPGCNAAGTRTGRNGLAGEATAVEAGAGPVESGLIAGGNDGVSGGGSIFAKGFGADVTTWVVTAGAATTGGAITLGAGGEGAGFTGASTLTKGLGPEDIGFGKFGLSAVPLNGLAPRDGWAAVVETGYGAVVILPAKGFTSGVGKVFTITGVPRFIWTFAGAVALGL